MSDPQHVSIVTAKPPPIQRMHPLVERGIAQIEDPATCRELLALQREWEAGEAKRAYTRAMIEMQQRLPHTLHKDSVVDFTNRAGVRTYYRHTSLAAFMEVVKPILIEHGFALTWHPNTVPSGQNIMVTVACRLTHVDGHFEQSDMTAHHDTSGAKSNPQGVASTATLLQRYTALMMLGIVTADLKEPGPKDTDDGAEGDQREGDKPQTQAVDAARNLSVVGKLPRFGKTVEDAEAFTGRKVSEWTDADIKNIEQWCKRPQKKADEKEGES